MWTEFEKNSARLCPHIRRWNDGASELHGETQAAAFLSRYSRNMPGLGLCGTVAIISLAWTIFREQ